jgi:hypothetical protein
MFNRSRAFLVTLAVLFGSVSSSALAEVRDATAMMKCCAKTQYACAGIGTPDDCCRKMHHSSSRVSPSVVRTSIVRHDAATIGPSLAPRFVVVREQLRAASESRPHDPPHLHTFSLLI